MPRTLNRRQFGVIAGSSLAATRLLAGSEYPPELGVQLYTLRSVLSSRPQQTLKEVADIGYREVEVLSQNFVELRPLLEQFQLEPVSGHFPAPLVTGNWDAWRFALPPGSENDTWDSVLEQAREQGLKYVVIAYLMAAERGGLDTYKRFADQMNRAGEVARSAGLQLCYHNHSFELAPMQGTTPLQVLMERFQAGLVGLELDVFWSHVGGVDPVEVLDRYRGRIPLVHLKDSRAPNVPIYDESRVPRTAFAEVGSGRLDFPAILKRGRQAGVKHYFVEQDHTPGDPLESLKASYQYLRQLKL